MDQTPGGDGSGKRKREPSGSVLQAKRLKAEPVEIEPQAGSDLAEQNERLVREQRKQLILRNRELRREVQVLEGRCEEARSAQESSEKSLAVITRYWNTLNDDLLLVARRECTLSAQQWQQQQSPATPTTAAAAAEPLPPPPPLLQDSLQRSASHVQNLLAEYDEFIHEDEVERIEKALVDRCKRTREVLGLVVQAILEERTRNDELMKLLKDDPGINKRDTSVHVLRDANSVLRTKNEELEKLLNEMRIEKGALNKKLAPLNDQLMKLQKENETLKLDAEDNKASLEKAMRNIDKMRLEQKSMKQAETCDTPVTPLSARTNSQFGSGEDKQQQQQHYGVPNGSATGSGGVNGGSDQSALEIEDLRIQLRGKVEEIDKAHRQCQILMEKNAELERLRVSEDFVKQTIIYAHMQNQIQTLGTMLKEEQDKVEYWRQKLEQLSSERRNLYEEKERELDKFRQEWMNKLHAKEREVVDLQNALAEGNNKAKNAQMQAEVSASYRQKYDELAKKLASREEEFKNRAKDFAVLDVLRKKLKEARNGEEGSRKHIKELTQKLEVFKSSPQDVRDMAELRANYQKYHERSKQLEEELSKLHQDAKETVQLRNEITEKKEEIEYLSSAFDKMCSSFDQMKAKHDDLTTKLREKEDEVTMRIREQLKLQQAQTQQAKEIQKYQEAMRSLEDLNGAKANEAQSQSQRAEWLRAQLEATQQELNLLKRLDEKLNQHLAIVCQTMEMERAERSKQNEATHQIATQLNEANVRIQKLDSKNSNLQSMVDSLQTRLARVQSGLADNDSDMELAYWKNAAICSVCSTRKKECVITRCFHLFCKECVRANLQVRNRKCPTCKKNFGQGDVRDIYE